MANVLMRRPGSGFVRYPKQCSQRLGGCESTFRTHCDMLVGPCACGEMHRESDGWVRQLLRHYNLKIETLILVPRKGAVRIPKYWGKNDYHRTCTALVGPCACGKTHTIDEAWVIELLDLHCAKIAGGRCKQ